MFKKNTPFEEYNIDKNLSFEENFKNYADFCTETNNNIGYVFAAVMFINDNYYYMILNTLRHNLDVLNRKAVI